MRTRIVAALFVVALAGGCGPATNRPRAATSPAPSAGTTSPSVAVSSSPPYDRAALSARAKKALVAPGALVGVGVATKPEDELDADYKLSDYCGQLVSGKARYDHVVHVRSWQSQSITVYNSVYGFDTMTAKEAIDSTRQHAESCPSYERQFDGGTVKVELLGVVDLSSVTGIDAGYGRCERRTVNNGSPYVACMAYLGRGPLVSTLNVWLPGSAAATTAKLLKIAPIAAAALAAA